MCAIKFLSDKISIFLKIWTIWSILSDTMVILFHLLTLKASIKLRRQSQLFPPCYFPKVSLSTNSNTSLS